MLQYASKNKTKNCSNKFQTNVIQRYKNVGNGYIQSYRKMPHFNRNIMVNEKQAATIYLLHGVEPPKEFSNLGIVALGSIPDPSTPPPPIHLMLLPIGSPTRYTICQFPLVDKRGYYTRYGQGRIPAVHSLGEGRQPLRSRAEKSKAWKRLNYQIEFLNSLRKIIIGKKQIPNNDMKSYFETQCKEQCQCTAIYALGQDIMDIVFSIKQILQIELQSDRVQMIQILLKDLDLRYSQLEQELDAISYKPVLPTGCEVSSQARSKLIGPKSEKATIEGGDFYDYIGWNFHYATNIPVSHLTHDNLFIEDAVGKSSHDNEQANAHWFARLYGIDENLLAKGGERISTNFQPKCKFNTMSYGIRRNFVKAKKITEGNKMSFSYVTYGDGSDKNFGTLTATLSKKLLFTYMFQNTGTNTLTFEMMDFLRHTADSVIDSMMIQDYIQDNEKHKNEFDESRVEFYMERQRSGKPLFPLEELEFIRKLPPG